MFKILFNTFEDDSLGSIRLFFEDISNCITDIEEEPSDIEYEKRIIKSEKFFGTSDHKNKQLEEAHIEGFDLEHFLNQIKEEYLIAYILKRFTMFGKKNHLLRKVEKEFNKITPNDYLDLC